MRSVHSFRSACFAVPLLSAFAHADTFVVDDSGGPGVDFTSIAAAASAGAAGDVVVVRTGTYSPFTLDRGLTIVAQGSVSIPGVSVIQFVGAGERAAVAGLSLTDLKVARCDGTVVLDSIDFVGESFEHLFVNQSADVRIRNVVMTPAEGRGARFIDSRVQVVGSTFRGKNGSNAIVTLPGDDGGSGLFVGSCPRVHLVRSSLLAGRGGFPEADCPGFLITPGGNGGTGLISSMSEVIAAGRASDVIRGGDEGYGYEAICDGLPGDGADVFGGSFRHSGVTLEGGGFFASAPALALFSGATASSPAPADPTLEFSGVPLPGGSVSLHIDGPVGSVVILVTSVAPEVAATPGVLIESLVRRDAAILLGVIPGSGTLVAPFAIAGETGSVLHAQAEIFPDRSTRLRTNSVELVAR